MNKEKKLEIQKALQAYTKKTTKSSSKAKKALVDEGIYLKDGKLAPEYKEPDIQRRWQRDMELCRHIDAALRDMGVE